MSKMESMMAEGSPKPQIPTLYAGLNVQGQPRIFRLDNDGEPIALTAQEWDGITDAMGCEPGEMPIVALTREAE